MLHETGPKIVHFAVFQQKTFASTVYEEDVERGVTGPNLFAPADDPDRFTAMVTVAATRFPIDTHPLALARLELLVLNRVFLDRDRDNERSRPG